MVQSSLVSVLVSAARRARRSLALPSLALVLSATSLFAAPAFRLPCRIDGYKGTEVLKDFPVLIRLSTAIKGFRYDRCAAQGEDVSFRLEDGTVLDREIDTWNPEGESLVWVRIPELKKGLTFYCEFGDSRVTAHPSCQTDGSVWKPAGYIGVWHMNEAEAVDSTASGHTGTPSAVQSTEGRLGTALYFNGSSWVDCGAGFDTAFKEGFSVETWLNYKRFSSHLAYCGMSGCFTCKLNGDHAFLLTTPGILDHEIKMEEGTSMTPDTWYHVVYNFAPGQQDGASAFLDGVLQGTMKASAMSAPSAASAFMIGKNDWGQNCNGTIDEFRFAKAVRSADWIAAVHDSAVDPAFVSAVQVISVEGVLAVRGEPADYGTSIPAYGFHEGYVAGATVDCRVQAAITNEAAGLIALCKGWKLFNEEGVLLGEGTSNAHSFEYVGYTSLDWLFERLYKVETVAKGGRIEGAASWESEGKSLTLKAVPDEGYEFLRWSGDFPAAGSTSPSVTFTHDRPNKVEAVFAKAGARRFYVAVDGDDLQGDGLTPETAFATPAEALSLARDGDSITVSSGRYDVEEPLVLGKGVLLEGTPASGETILARVGANVTNLVIVAHSNAVVRDVVLDGNGQMWNWGLNGVLNWYSLLLISEKGGLVEKCVLRNAHTQNNVCKGGGAWMLGGVLRDCVLTNNFLQSSGGDGRWGAGLAIEGGLAERCYIARNTSASGSGSRGAGAYVGGTGVLRNSLIVDNIARFQGSGLWMSGGLVENCTVAGNHQDEGVDVVDLAGVYLHGGTLRNSISYGNWNTKGPMELAFAPWAHNIEFCCADVFPEPFKKGNVVASPHFVDMAKGDYRLASGLCINAGTNQPWMAEGAVDFGGAPRLHDEIVDMGCYEFVPTKLDCSFDATNTKGLESVEATFSAHVVGPDLAGIVYTWDLGDGSQEITGPDKAELSHRYNRSGVYTVALRVTNAAGDTAVSYQEDVIIVCPKVLHVDRKSTTPKVPYDSWETAATNIMDAVSVCLDGTTILVNDGVYSSTNAIKLLADIDLRSVNGAEATTLQVVRPDGKTTGDMPACNVVYAGDPRIVIDGFTITGSGWSGLNLPKGGTVENCIVRDIRTINLSVSGAGINMGGPGVIRNCVVRNNYTKSSGGYGIAGGAIYALKGALIDSCTIISNRTSEGTFCWAGGIYARDSTIRNCLIAWNVSSHNSAGAHIYNGTIENCTIVSNSSLYTVSQPANPDHKKEFASGLVLEWNATARNLVIYGNTFADGTLAEARSMGDDQEKNRFFDCLVSNPEWLHGERNFAADPLFQAPSKGLFRLRSSSPARNRGVNQEWMETATDLAGNKRIVQRVVDLGCYENTTTPATMLLLR